MLVRKSGYLYPGGRNRGRTTGERLRAEKAMELKAIFSADPSQLTYTEQMDTLNKTYRIANSFN